MADLCACGCGAEIPPNPRRRRPARFIQNHSLRINSRALREAWPTEREVRDLLVELGTLTAVAARLGRSRTAMLMIAHSYGIEWTPTGRTMAEGKTRVGWSGEEHAALVLGAEIARSNDPRRQPFDLLWEGRAVDVKTARPTHDRPGAPTIGWTWHVRRAVKRAHVDLFFCIACADDGLPLRYFLIPADQIGERQTIRISGSLEGRWTDFEVRPRITI